MGSQRPAPPTLHPGKTWYSLFMRLGGPHGWSGRVQKISPPTGIRSPDRQVRCELLHRLRYTGPHIKYLEILSARVGGGNINRNEKEVKESYGEVHSELFHNLYCSLDIIKINTWKIESSLRVSD